MRDVAGKQTLAGVITGIFAVVTQAVIGFFLTPFIVRVLGEEANGFAQLAGNFVMYASLLTVAFNSMGGRFLSVSYHNGDLEKTNRYFSSLLVCNLAIILLLLPVAGFIVWRLDSLLSIETADVGDVKRLFLCVFVHFFINQGVSLYSMSMFVRNRMFLQNIILFVRTFLNALILLCVFTWLPPHIYYVSATALFLTALVLPVCMGIHRKLLPSVRFSFRKFDFSRSLELLRSGIWNTVNQGGHMLMTGMDLLLANLFIDPLSMGVLSVSKVVPTFILHLATTLNANLTPSVTIRWAAEGSREALAELHRGMKLSCILIAAPMMVFCGLAVDFYALWTPGMDAPQLSLLSFLTCMSLIPMAGPQVLYNTYTASNKLRVNALSFLATGVLNIVLVYAVLASGTQWGIYAIAGISSALSILRNMVVTLPYTARILHLKWYSFYQDALLSLLCCGLSFGIVLGVRALLPGGNWWALIGKALLSFLLASGLEVLLLLRRGERAQLLSKLRMR